MNVLGQTGQFLRRPLARGTVLSVAMHALLFVLLALLTVWTEYFPAKFAEVTFVSGERGALAPAPGPSAEPKGGQLPPPPPSVQTEPVREETVTLPPRRMLEHEPPEQLPRSGEKLDVAPSAPQVATPAPGSGKQEQALRPPAPAEEGKASAPLAAGAGQKEAPPAATGPTAGAPESFRIEGEAAHRQIFYKVIPEYPPGLQQEAVVRVRFLVLPDGSVGSMVPVLKGDPTLERVTLEALRQWRFNPLPAHAPQIEVTGIITFRYLLR